jgi:RNA polymerase sigma factor (sigma-70 family)
MVKDDFWSEPADDSSDVEIHTTNHVQVNTPIFNTEVDATQPSQQATNEITTSSSQTSIIPKTSLSIPIIFEDIWGDDIGDSTFIDTPSFSIDPDQTIYTDAESDSEEVEGEKLLGEIDDDETYFLSENGHGSSTLLRETAPLMEHENAPGLLTGFEQVLPLIVFNDELEQDFLLNDIELLDIDAALAELDDKEASFSDAKKKAAGVVIGLGNVAGWMGHYGLFYINWEYGEEAEQEALKRLGYADLEISETTRAFVLQAARAARLPRRQERELTLKLDQTRSLRAQLPNCKDPDNDIFADQRAELNAEIVDIERTLVSKMQWVAVKKATQFVGRGIDLDDLIQFGMLGVISGVKHYDVNKNARLVVAVNWWVFQSLNRAVSEFARFIRVPVYIAEILTHIKKQHTALQISLGRLPTLKELATKVQVPVERLKQLLRLNEKPVSLEWCKLTEDAHEGYSFQPFTNASTVSEDTLSEDTLNEAMDILDMKQYVEAMLQLLSMREKQVIKLRYGLDEDEHELTLEEIGKILHITRERVRQIEERAFRKFRNKYSLTRKIWNDYFLTKKKVIKVQKSPQKIEENTLKAPSQHEPKQREITKDSKPLLKVDDVESQKNIREVDGYIYERILSRNGFIWSRNTDQDAKGVKSTIDKGKQKLLAKINRVRKNLNS